MVGEIVKNLYTFTFTDIHVLIHIHHLYFHSRTKLATFVYIVRVAVVKLQVERRYGILGKAHCIVR